MKLATQRLLSFPELAAFRIEAFGVGNLLAIAQGNQAGHTQIYPNFTGAFWQWLNLDIHQQGNCPASSRRELHRNNRWSCTWWQFSTPGNRQGFRTLGKKDLPVSELEGRLGKLCAAAVAFLLEGGVFRPPVEEVRECFLKVSQSLLQWDTANLVEELQIFLLFPFGQHCRSIAVTDSLLLFVPSLCSHSKGAIVDQTSTAPKSVSTRFLVQAWDRSGT